MNSYNYVKVWDSNKVNKKEKNKNDTKMTFCQHAFSFLSSKCNCPVILSKKKKVFRFVSEVSHFLSNIPLNDII